MISFNSLVHGFELFDHVRGRIGNHHPAPPRLQEGLHSRANASLIFNECDQATGQIGNCFLQH